MCRECADKGLTPSRPAKTKHKQRECGSFAAYYRERSSFLESHMPESYFSYGLSLLDSEKNCISDNAFLSKKISNSSGQCGSTLDHSLSEVFQTRKDEDLLKHSITQIARVFKVKQGFFSCSSLCDLYMLDWRLGCLSEFHTELFVGKDILDVGCNAGKVSLTVGSVMRAKSVLGIDIDARLIWKARDALQRLQSQHDDMHGSMENASNMVCAKDKKPRLRSIGVNMTNSAENNNKGDKKDSRGNHRDYELSGSAKVPSKWRGRTPSVLTADVSLQKVAVASEAKRMQSPSTSLFCSICKKKCIFNKIIDRSACSQSSSPYSLPAQKVTAFYSKRRNTDNDPVSVKALSLTAITNSNIVSGAKVPSIVSELSGSGSAPQTKQDFLRLGNDSCSFDCTSELIAEPDLFLSNKTSPATCDNGFVLADDSHQYFTNTGGTKRSRCQSDEYDDFRCELHRSSNPCLHTHFSSTISFAVADIMAGFRKCGNAQRNDSETKPRTESCFCSLARELRDQQQLQQFPDRVAWLSESSKKLFDVVICFSLTKWIHLNHGDIGLLYFFSRLHQLLKPKGLLLLEPQDWASYRRARRICPTFRKTLPLLRLHPNRFHLLLTERHACLCSCKYCDARDMKQYHSPVKESNDKKCSVTMPDFSETRKLSNLSSNLPVSSSKTICRETRAGLWATEQNQNTPFKLVQILHPWNALVQRVGNSAMQNGSAGATYICPICCMKCSNCRSGVPELPAALAIVDGESRSMTCRKKILGFNGLSHTDPGALCLSSGMCDQVTKRDMKRHVSGGVSLVDNSDQNKETQLHPISQSTTVKVQKNVFGLHRSLVSDCAKQMEILSRREGFEITNDVARCDTDKDPAATTGRILVKCKDTLIYDDNPHISKGLDARIEGDLPITHSFKNTLSEASQLVSFPSSQLSISSAANPQRVRKKSRGTLKDRLIVILRKNSADFSICTR